MQKKYPALVAVAAFSGWMIWMGSQDEGRPQGGGGMDARAGEHLAMPPPGPVTPDASAEGQERTVSRTEDAQIAKGSSLSSTLRKLGLDVQEIHRFAKSAREHHDLRRLAAGTAIRAVWDDFVTVPPQRLELKLDQTRTLVGLRDGDGGWTAEIHEAVVTTELAAYAGVVTTTLWNSASIAGMDPDLIHALAEVFAWQIDFNREVQEGDRWRLTVERRFVDGQAIGFGAIVAAEYENAGRVHSAIRYAPKEGFAQYFAPDGTSTRRMFLKSPLKFGRITSGFSSRRFHPILQVNKPHLGVDYGAPEGTPIMAVGDGVVTTARWKDGGGGNVVEIKHNSAYSTAYKHLSRFGAGIRAGAKVQMGQVIGYVGSTGLATGPHLHFEFNEHGRYVDPQGIRFPTADPVPPKELTAYLEVAAQALQDLPPWSSAVLSQRRTTGESVPNE